ncbi:phosphoribosyltransferase-like protein [Herbaspirillum seropedicae]|uniref:phosphoribosyltransferase-like protein n=1 Tax=Herbaspirillum seropedicae TaxID=964 RepID=UPI003F8D3009
MVPETKATVLRAMELYRTCPWLLDRSEQITYLLNECGEHGEIDLVIDLVLRFTYFSAEDYQSAFSAIAKQIAHVWALDEKNTQIVSLTMDSSADSGQSVIHALKGPLTRIGKTAYPLINRVEKVNSRANTHHNIVLVDEFSGTGSTLKNRIKWINERWKNNELRPHIYVCLIAGMNHSISAFKDVAEDIFVYKKLEKAISEKYEGAALYTALENMAIMEKRLAQEVQGKPLPSLGYGKAEALFGNENNIPNSTLPIFWWPQLASGETRKTLFFRYSI